MASSLVLIPDRVPRKRASPGTEVDSYADAFFPSPDRSSLFQEHPSPQLDHRLASFAGSDSSREKHRRIDVVEGEQRISSLQSISAEALASEAVGLQSDNCLRPYVSCSPNSSPCGVDALEELLSDTHQSLLNVLDTEKPAHVAESCYGEEINCILKNWEEDVTDVFSKISDFRGCDRPLEIASCSLNSIESNSDRIGEIWREEVEDNWFFDALELQCNGEGPYPDVSDVEWITETLDEGNFYATSA